MKPENEFDVIIVGGSYSGLAAAMALGRAMRKVLVLDAGAPCNRQTPRSHNFLTQDGKTPSEIASLARQQVAKYPTVQLLEGLATAGARIPGGFEITTEQGKRLRTRKLIFATGIKDLFPVLPGLAECWGISVLHCPYCHGYEVRDEKTGILGNGEYGFEFATLISNWTSDLALFTNGASTLTPDQAALLKKHNIPVEDKSVARLKHVAGKLQRIIFSDGSTRAVTALYTRLPFQQHSSIPVSLGCELTEEGYIKTDVSMKTTQEGIFASGDNSSRIRTVANAVSSGTTAGMMVNKELVSEEFVTESNLPEV